MLVVAKLCKGRSYLGVLESRVNSHKFSLVIESCNSAQKLSLQNRCVTRRFS